MDPRDPGEARVLGLEFVFSFGLWLALFLLMRHAAAITVVAMAERKRTHILRGVDPTAAARDAVVAERERLSGELDKCIRQALEDIRTELDSAQRGNDPRAAALQIHLRSREATSELRRQLGLLRGAPPDQAVEPKRDRSPAGLTRPTIALTAVLMALAAVDAWAGSTLYGPEFYESSAFRLPWSGLLGIATAAAVIAWRIAPVTAAMVAAAALVVPRQAGHLMISAGFGLLATLGCLMWSLGKRGASDRKAITAAILLEAAAVGSRLRDDPLNSGFLAATAAVAWGVGWVVGSSQRRRAAAARQGRERQAEIDAALDVAVRAERLAVARELHDVVSHAVGVIAMQAAAAQVSWPAEPRTALTALETIDQTAAQALADLDRVIPDGAHEGSHDLDALVARIRATGTEVVLVRRGPATVDSVLYRIVQEGLTNAIRHAPGARIEVVIEAAGDAVRVQVVDGGPGPGDASPRGFGLVGLTERVKLRGGTVRSGPGPGGRGFVLEATLPVAEVER